MVPWDCYHIHWNYKKGLEDEPQMLITILVVLHCIVVLVYPIQSHFQGWDYLVNQWLSKMVNQWLSKNG